uniref:Uncharacterized protein n=1 Tax=Suricata suricatta TaxID=37032 RepID=A0A673SX57_SURSU
MIFLVFFVYKNLLSCLHHQNLRPWSFLLAFVQGQKRDIGYFDDLNSNSGNVTNSMTFATKSSNQNLIVFLSKIKTTIIGYKGGDFLAILDQPDPDALPDGRLWLFGFNPHFFQHNSFCMGSASKSVGLQGCGPMSFLVLFIMPLLVSSGATELPGSTKTRTLAHPASTTGPSQMFYIPDMKWELQH